LKCSESLLDGAARVFARWPELMSFPERRPLGGPHSVIVAEAI
jgi:hypothetical protein